MQRERETWLSAGEMCFFDCYISRHSVTRRCFFATLLVTIPLPTEQCSLVSPSGPAPPSLSHHFLHSKAFVTIVLLAPRELAPRRRRQEAYWYQPETPPTLQPCVTIASLTKPSPMRMVQPRCHTVASASQKTVFARWRLRGFALPFASPQCPFLGPSGSVKGLVVFP